MVQSTAGAADLHSEILPSLYDVSPSLQALAVTDGYVDPNAISNHVLQRRLPLTPTAGLEVDIAEDFEAFKRDVAPGDCIAVINGSGTCVWTTGEAQELVFLRGILAGIGPASNGDDAMDEG